MNQEVYMYIKNQLKSRDELANLHIAEYPKECALEFEFDNPEQDIRLEANQDGVNIYTNFGLIYEKPLRSGKGYKKACVLTLNDLESLIKYGCKQINYYVGGELVKTEYRVNGRRFGATITHKVKLLGKRDRKQQMYIYD